MHRLHCKSCEYSTNLLSNLRTHVFRIHMNALFSCPNCDKGFRSRAEALTHLRETHGLNEEGLIMCHCNVCSFSTDDYKTFEEHCEVVHFPPGSRKHKKTKRMRKDTGMKVERKAIFSNKGHYEMNPDRERRSDCPTNIRCNICASDARDGRDLVVHKLITHGLCKYTCSKCDFKTRMAATMSVHGQKAHKESIKMKLSCGFCPMSGKMYATKEHLTTAHPNEFNKRMVAKLYYCNFCKNIILFD